MPYSVLLPELLVLELRKQFLRDLFSWLHLRRLATGIGRNDSIFVALFTEFRNNFN